MFNSLLYFRYAPLNTSRRGTKLFSSFSNFLHPKRFRRERNVAFSFDYDLICLFLNVWAFSVPFPSHFPAVNFSSFLLLLLLLLSLVNLFSLQILFHQYATNFFMCHRTRFPPVVVSYQFITTGFFLFLYLSLPLTQSSGFCYWCFSFGRFNNGRLRMQNPWMREKKNELKQEWEQEDICINVCKWPLKHKKKPALFSHSFCIQTNLRLRTNWRLSVLKADDYYFSIWIKIFTFVQRYFTRLSTCYSHLLIFIFYCTDLLYMKTDIFQHCT